MKFYRYFIVKSVFIIIVVIVGSLRGMQDPHGQKIVIVDHHEKISDFLPCSPATEAKIGVFGASPRYTRFLEYSDKVIQHYQLALDMKCKNVGHNILSKAGELPERSEIKFKDVFGKKMNAALGHFIPHLELHEKARKDVEMILQNFQDHEEENCYYFEELIEIFLRFGIDNKTIKSNLQSMVDAAIRNQMTCLVHVFLPSYFVHVREISSGTIHLFLKYTAEYFKNIYQNLDLPAQMQVIILIPPAAEILSKTTQEIIYSNILARVSQDHISYAFINQVYDENEALCSIFESDYNIHVQNVHFDVYNSQGHKIEKIFTPYRHIGDYKTLLHDARAMRLLSPELHEYLKENVFEQDFEDDGDDYVD